MLEAVVLEEATDEIEADELTGLSTPTGLEEVEMMVHYPMHTDPLALVVPFGHYKF